MRAKDASLQSLWSPQAIYSFSSNPRISNMYAKFSAVFAVVLIACAGVEGIASPATRSDAATRCPTIVVLATATSTHYVTQYTTATANPVVTKRGRGDDHPHALAARQAAPVTTTVTSTSTRTVAMSTSTVITTLTNTSTARGSGATTVTSTVTGQPAGRTETVTSTITSMATTTAPTPTPTVTTTVFSYITLYP
ncbi:hypothetical protein K466DRAFT_189926 [Polyporus arcularius HHB13444]|uniref:Uncharacterized protein n=1 Tax=Polyporus arcularius HHB13444 TaxID=1314778 RepID=A0A5C3P7Z3_9APHY|nr:hypothetical protein K466DRAFT_189926 [Polyporus arcularius HHB13444]